MSRNVLRRHVSMPGLLSTVRKVFDTVPDPTSHRAFSLSDCLMSGLAMFSLKYPSLLEFDNETRGEHPNPAIVHNLKHLFKVAKTPSDSCLRQRLDVIDPRSLRDAFQGVFTNLQRGKGLEHFTSLGHYLLSIDGTGYFSSKRVKCASCCTKHHRDGTTTYYHQMLGGALVHPTIKTVFPLAPEMIDNRDGSTKNNCERKAMKRFITSFREDHPHLKTIVLADGLASNAPTITQLKSHNLRFILGAKPGDHKVLFNWVVTSPLTRSLTRQTYEKNKTITHHFTWLNKVPLNESNMDLEVNVLLYTETSPTGQKRRWSWVSDLTLESTNMMAVMRAGRTRWRIENDMPLSAYGYRALLWYVQASFTKTDTQKISLVSDGLAVPYDNHQQLGRLLSIVIGTTEDHGR